MAASNAEPFANSESTMQTDMADTDMREADDIDYSVDPEIYEMMVDHEQQRALHKQNGPAPTTEDILTDIVPEKVNIQGLDNLTTTDVMAFIREYDNTANFVKLEWINDTSANIVYQSADAALQALNTFTNSGITEWSITTIPASGIRTKPAPSHPDVDLRVRLATVSDVKKPRAREASKFYLHNPEYDPGERNRNGRGRKFRREYRPRDGSRDSRTFDVSLYDDDAGLETEEESRMRNMRGDSYSSGPRDMDTSGDDSGRKRVRFRPRRTDDFGRLRDRSASPAPDGDGRMGFQEDENSVRRRIRQRSQTPPSYRREARNNNHSKELFSVKSSDSSFLSSSSNGKELFANKSSPARRPKEVFPHKTPTSNHRRSDAIDGIEEVPELFKRPSLADRITPRSLFDRVTYPRDLASRITAPRDLTDRITPKEDSYGRLKDDNGDSQGINIRGTAEQASGFSIRGAAANDSNELFRDRELFSSKINGRGGPRRRAEDLFD